MHHLFFLCFALLIPLVFLGGCGSSASDAYHKITAEAGHEMIRKDHITVIDVREPSEYSEGHVPTAKLIPLGTIDESVTEKLPDKKAPVIVYCRSGVRSKKADNKLVGLGYTDVRDMGGILDWPYEIEKQG